jgi:hypothetical protein
MVVVAVVLPACSLAFDKMFDSTLQEPDPYVMTTSSKTQLPPVAVTFQYHKMFLSAPQRGTASREARLCVKYMYH